LATLHVAIDEAGCFGFNKHGSKYYVFTAAYTYDPQPLALELTNLRFGLLKQGHDIPAFHCCEDRQANRDAVVNRLLNHTGWSFASVVVEKRKVNPVLYPPDKFYPRFATPLLRFVLRGNDAKAATSLIVCTDILPTGRKDAVSKTLKMLCAKELTIPLGLYHHPRFSNKWIQVADYCCWGIQRKWEKADRRTYDQLRPTLAKAELDLCAWGDQTNYY
jgi:hypothetical protein